MKASNAAYAAVVADECNIVGTLDNIADDIRRNIHYGVLSAYTNINSACWSLIAKHIIEVHNDNTVLVGNVYAKRGALITVQDMSGLPQYLAANRAKLGSSQFVGYFDIFNTKALKGTLWDNNGFRECTANELELIKGKRTKFPRPLASVTMELFGILDPYAFRKLPNAPMTNLFKLVGTDPTKVNKDNKGNGAECKTKTRPDIESYLTRIGVAEEQNKGKNKEQLCSTLAIELIKINRMFTYPEYIPKV